DRLVDEMQNLSLVTQHQSKQIQKYIEQFGEYNPDIWKHRRTRDLIDSLCRGIGLYHLEMSPLSRSLVTTVFQSGLLQILIIPETLYTVTQLQQRDMLPGIYFIFSRVGCDLAVQECYLAIEELKLISLITPEETAELKQRIDEFLILNPEAARNDKIEYLYRGVAAHHAGILPVWKALIEELFGKGLIKIVFATETLAAGINMPARTTVISSISKRTDEGHRLLTASEFLQMSGRAGRRGKDKIGHVVTLQTPFEGAEIAAKLATKGADPLISQFTPSYGMVLNLLQTHSLTEIKELIERSFGQYLATLDLKPLEEELGKLQTELRNITAKLGDISEEQIGNFIKLSESLKEGKRLVKILVKQAEKEQAKQVSSVILSAEPGMIVYLKGKHIPTGSPIPAVLVSKIKNSEQVSYLICLSKSNKWYVCSISDVLDYEAEKTIKNIPIPPFDLSFKLGEKRKGTKEDGAFVADIPDKYEGENLAPEVREEIAKVKEMERLLENHPVQKLGDTKTAIAYQEEREILKMQIEELEETIEQTKAIHWQQFLDLIAILQQTKALEELKPTKLGEIAAALRGENELWLGIALYSGLLDDLDPHHLAATCAALVIETPRPDSWTEYNFSSEVETVINDLRRRKRDLLHIQYKYQVMMPLWLEDGLIGLIEKWALGVKWLELCQNTSLDEGDLVRMLRRTLDLLSQIPHVPHIPDTLKQNAIRAIQLIDRFPVNELVT
ncbi:MAG TPA: helicase-related protein, partial [Allocoleopsis sp.]